MKDPPGRYQELDLFIKVLRLLCPNLTDASKGLEGPTLINWKRRKVGQPRAIKGKLAKVDS